MAAMNEVMDGAAEVSLIDIIKYLSVRKQL